MSGPGVFVVVNVHADTPMDLNVGDGTAVLALGEAESVTLDFQSVEGPRTAPEAHQYGPGHDARSGSGGRRTRRAGRGCAVSWSPGEGVDTSIGLGVGYKEPVDLRVDRSNGTAYLILGAHVAEIRLERGHLETIDHQLAGVFADLDQMGGAVQRSGRAGGRAMELAAYLTDQAVSAEQAGKLDAAGELRGTADKLTAAVTALEKAVLAVDDAALVADRVCEDATRLLDARIAAEQQPGGQGAEGDRPADVA